MYAKTRTPPRLHRPLFPWLIASLAAVGVGLRVWVLMSGLGTVDADEAIVGLMARHMPSELPTFYWGQEYGGPQEAWLTWLVFGVAGSSVGAFKAVPVALSAVAAVLIWRIGRRTVGSRAAALGAALFWVWPAAFVSWSTKLRGFYWSTLVLGLVAFLLVLRLSEDRKRWWPDAAGLGVVAGLGWWASPQIVYLLVPVSAWVVLRRPSRIWRLAAAAPTFLLAALPWLLANLRSGWASFDTAPPPVESGYIDHLGVFFVDGLPQALGLKSTWRLEWLAGVGPAVYALALAGFVAVVVHLARTRRLQIAGPAPVVATAAAYPFIFAVSPYSWYVFEPRYLLFAAPAVALLVAWGLTSIRGGPWVGSFGAVALTVWGIAAMLSSGFVTQAAPDARLPVHMGPLVETLSDEGIDHVFADYWLAYRLTFESDERIVAASVASMVRYPPYQEAVRTSPRPAYVFVDGSALVPRFEAALRRLEIGSRRLELGGFVVHVPERKVLPEQIPEVWSGGGGI